MPKFASRNVLTAAIAFAVIVVAVSLLGVGGGELLFYLLYLVPMLLILYFIVRWAVAAGIRDTGGTGFPGVRTARDILDERYARGEIGPEEYGQVRREIETP